MSTFRIGRIVSELDVGEKDPPTYIFSGGREFWNYAIPSADDYTGTAISDGEFIISDGENIIIDG